MLLSGCSGVKHVAIGQLRDDVKVSLSADLKKRHNTNEFAYRLLSLVRAYQVFVVVWR